MWEIGGKKGGVVQAVGWQGAQDAKRSERPRPVSAGAAARNHARTYDMKSLTCGAAPIRSVRQERTPYHA